MVSFLEYLGGKIVGIIAGISLVLSGGARPATKPALPITEIPKPAITVTVVPTSTPQKAPTPIPVKTVAKPKPVVKSIAKKTTQPAPAPQKIIPTTTPIVTAPPLPIVPSVPAPNPSELNLRTREAVVNILCTTQSSGPFQPISGSGVVIDSRGVILTNAHVAQYFLLKDFQVPDFIDCVIRTGSPASPSYRAKLIYISSRWVKENAAKVKLSESQGTGENDYALLRITGPVNEGSAFPASFTAIAPDTTFNGVTDDNQMLLVSYPAELLGGILTQTRLSQVSSLATIKQGFFFASSTPDFLDIFSIGGNAVAQGGSSGGAAVRSSDGKLLGILVTSTIARETENRDLKTVTLSHIERSITRETGKALAQFLDTTLDQLQEDFELNSFGALKRTIENAIRNVTP